MDNYIKIRPEYQGKPFWAWNGKLEISELKYQIDVMKQMGFGGFFMHSRTGLETEYLGDKWFDLINECAVYAHSLGMEAWLYDEDRWPSGTAGGLVAKNPSFAQRFISLYFDDIADCNVLGRFAYNDIDGDYYSVKSKSDVKDGYRYLVFVEELMASRAFYNGYTYVDTLNIEATNKFFELTHEKYKEKCGHLFGKELKGVFVDEPNRGSLFCKLGADNSNTENMCPYTGKLFDAYEKDWGECLRSKLPELYFNKNDFNVTAYRYIETVQCLFLESFAIPYQKWCKENNLLLTGHVLHEDTLTAQTLFSGSIMRYFEYMDYPGIDNLTNNNPVYAAAKQCASVARQLGKGHVLSELYGATGWEKGLADYKRIGDWQAFYGVTLRCPHLSWYTMKGEAKRDYPASILHQNSIYEDYAYIEDYFSRLNGIFLNTQSTAELAVINPIEQIWGEVRKGWSQAFLPTGKRGLDIEERCKNVLDALQKMHIDFDYVDEDILSRHYKIEKCNGKVYLKVGHVRYSQVLYDFQSQRPSTNDIIEQFRVEGGIVLSDPSQCSAVVPIKSEQDIAVTLRKDDSDFYIIAMNFNTGIDFSDCRIEVGLTDYFVYEIDLFSGREYQTADSAECINTALYNNGTRAFRLSKQAPTAREVKANALKSKPLAKKIEFDGDMPYKLNSDNILVLDSAECVCGDFSAQDDILKLDIKLREHRGMDKRGSEMIQPWFRKKYFATEKTADAPPITLHYKFEAMQVSDIIKLATEWQGEVRINGQKVESMQERWVDCCFTVYDIKPYIKIGKNTVTLTGNFLSDTDLEAVYILGDFGVQLPDKLIKLPEKINPKHLISSGLPFYSGSVRFRTALTGQVEIKFNKTQNVGAIKVISGNETVNASIYPHIVCIDASHPLEVEYVLTRRNTFGPLHLPNPLQDVYGPEAWLTEKENWSNAPVLID